MPEDFVHCHVHSEFSAMDGFAKISKLAERTREYGQPGIAITDHGNTNGWVVFWKACKAVDIKPILGVEAYIVDDMCRRGVTDEEKAKHCSGLAGAALRNRMREVEKMLGVRKRYHITLLAKNYAGYRNICRLVTVSNRAGFYYKPRIDFPTLFQYKEGIIATSACMAGKIPQLILATQGITAYSEDIKDIDFDAGASSEDVEDEILKMKEEFGGDFYFEIQAIDMKEQSIINSVLAALSIEYNIPLIATNDIHYVGKEDYKAHDVLLAIQGNFGRGVARIDDPNRWRFSTNELWLKPRQQMIDDLKDFNLKNELSSSIIEAACDNTMEVFEKIQFDPGKQFSDPKVIPSVYLPKSYYPFSYGSAQKKTNRYKKACEKFLWDSCVEGWNRKVKGKKVARKEFKAYKQRLQYEFKLIKGLGFVEYFIIVVDLIKWAKSQDILVGPSRGSSCGSLVCYLCDVTEIDPMRWKVMFERFISPNRTDNPDVDIDFDPRRREEVKQYLFDKYGERRVALVGSNILFKGRMVLQDVARVYGIKPREIEEIKKLIIQRSGADRRASFTLLDSMSEFEICKRFHKEYPEVVDSAAELEGQVKSFGVHAGGVLVADKPLWNYCSVRRDSKGGKVNIVAGVDKHDIEDLGLLKIDILGVDELTMISKAIGLIKERHNVDIKPWEIDPEDEASKAVYEAMGRGETVGIFQLHSKGITRLCQNIQPDCFEDVAAITALHRPGPLMSGAAHSYGPLKRDEKPRRDWHPIIQNICDNTYGEILYQEQLMAIVRECANFSWAQTGDLRKTISKNVGVEYFHTTYLGPWFEGCWKNDKWLSGLKTMYPNEFVGTKERNIKKLRKLSDRVAEKTFTSFLNFGSWSMNFAHAISYAYISYVSMWLKINYPIEFMCACLEVENQEEMRRKIINEIKRMGIPILPPDVTKSKAEFSIEDGENDVSGIRCGLADVKGVGAKACKSIVENGPYKSIYTFENRVERRIVHKGVMRSLIMAGAFESMYPNTKALLENLEDLLAVSKKYDGKLPKLERKCYNRLLSDSVEDFPEEEKVRMKESVTTMVSGKPLITFYDDFLVGIGIRTESLAAVGELADSGKQIKRHIYVRATIRGIDLKRYSQEVNYVIEGEDDFRYCLLDLEDEADFVMGSVGPIVYKKYEKKIWEWGVGAPVLVKGSLFSGRRKLYVIDMISLDDLRAAFEGGNGNSVKERLDWNGRSIMLTVKGSRDGISRARTWAKKIFNGKAAVSCEKAWGRSRLQAVGYISGTNVVSTKKDPSKKMIFTTLEDDTGIVPVMVWPGDFEADGRWIEKVFLSAEDSKTPVRVDLRKLSGTDQYPDIKFVVDYQGRASVLPLTRKNVSKILSKKRE